MVSIIDSYWYEFCKSCKDWKRIDHDGYCKGCGKQLVFLVE